MKRIVLLSASALVVSLGLTSPTFALSQKECSVKYQAAKSDGSLNGRKYADFRKQECGAGATAATTPAESTPAATPARAAPAGGALAYPTAIDPKYASETPGKGRMHTCLDAYKAAKANGTLGGMRWIQKGGGYYSTCNARLKA